MKGNMRRKRLHFYTFTGLLLIIVAALGAARNIGGTGVYLLSGIAGSILMAAWLCLGRKAAPAPAKKKQPYAPQPVYAASPDEKAILIHREDLEPLSDQLHRLIENPDKRYRVTCRMQLPDGKTRAVTSCIGVQPEDASADDGQEIVPQDIGALLEARMALAHDSLTGLLSKASMMSLIEKDLQSRRTSEGCVGLFVIDINNYRVVNTRYGYSMGDRVLSEVGRRLNGLSSDQILVGRIESNNFVVYIKNLQDGHEMKGYAQRIEQVFEGPINLGTGDIDITASVGGAVMTTTHASLDSIMSYAFTALAQAKTCGQGNNYQLFNNSMKQGADRRAQIIHILETHQQTGSMLVYYQPQYSSQNGSLHGLEALLRIIDGQLGMVAPHEFISIAEETGLIVDVGYWCIRECCRAVKRFRKAGLLFTAISINVSLVQLTAPDFFDRIREIILEEEVDPSLLAFEITESMLMCSMEHGEELLLRLKDFGLRVVLDDFGSGYSSLNYIRALSIDTLKIDKSFIDGICTDGKSKYIIELILNLAEKINLEVVAEGVETQEQLDVLCSFSCPIIQGFYFSKPIPEGEVVTLLRGA